MHSKDKTCKTNKGFTIIELAMVIVIIAILAAVSLVAYNGITDRANDVAVQDMISNLDAQVAADATFAESGQCPSSTTLTYDDQSTAYDRSTKNIFYIYGSIGDFRCNYAFVVVSASGRSFYMTTIDDKIQEYTGPAYKSGDFAMFNYFLDQFGWNSGDAYLSILREPEEAE